MHLISVFSLFVLPIIQLTSTNPLSSGIDCNNKTHLCRTRVQFYPCEIVGQNTIVVLPLEPQNCPVGFVCDDETEIACQSIETHTSTVTTNEATGERVYLPEYLSPLANIREYIFDKRSDEKTEKFPLNFNNNDESRGSNIQNTRTSDENIEHSTFVSNVEQSSDTTSNYHMFTHDTTVTRKVYNTNWYDTSTLSDEYPFEASLNTQEDYNTKTFVATVSDDFEEHTSKMLLDNAPRETTATNSNNCFNSEDCIENTRSDEYDAIEYDHTVQDNLSTQGKRFDIDNDTLEEDITTLPLDRVNNIATGIYNKTIYDVEVISTTTPLVIYINNSEVVYGNIVNQEVDNNNINTDIDDKATRLTSFATPNINLLEQYAPTQSETAIISVTPFIAEATTKFPREDAQTDNIIQGAATVTGNIYSSIDTSSNERTTSANLDTSLAASNNTRENEYYIEGDTTTSISFVGNLSSTNVDKAITRSEPPVFTDVSTILSVIEENFSEDQSGILEENTTVLDVLDNHQLLFLTQNHHIGFTTENNTEEAVSVTTISIPQNNNDNFNEPAAFFETTITESVDQSTQTNLDIEATQTLEEHRTASEVLDDHHQLSLSTQNQNIGFTTANDIKQKVSASTISILQDSNANSDAITTFMEATVTEFVDRSSNVNLNIGIVQKLEDNTTASEVLDEHQLVLSIQGQEIGFNTANDIEKEVSANTTSILQHNNDNSEKTTASIETIITKLEYQSGNAGFSSNANDDSQSVTTVVNNNDISTEYSVISINSNEALQYSATLKEDGASIKMTTENDVSNTKVTIETHGENEEYITELRTFTSWQWPFNELTSESVYLNAHEKAFTSILNTDETEYTTHGFTSDVSIKEMPALIKSENTASTISSIQYDSEKDLISRSFNLEITSANQEAFTESVNKGIATRASTHIPVNVDLVTEATGDQNQILPQSNHLADISNIENITTDVIVSEASVKNEGNFLHTITSVYDEDDKSTIVIPTVPEVITVTPFLSNSYTFKVSKPKLQSTASTAVTSTTPPKWNILPTIQIDALPIDYLTFNSSEFICTGPGKFPDTKDCSIYHLCVDILVKYVHVLRRCPPGTLYDRTGQDCTRKPVECSQDFRLICTINGVFPHPFDCSRYYKCFWRAARGKFMLWQFSCPGHMKYDSQKGVCVSEALFPNCGDSSYGLQTLESPFYCRANGRFPVEYSCDSYYECKEKKGVLQMKVKTCSLGKLFDRELGACRKSDMVFCPYEYDNSSADSSE